MNPFEYNYRLFLLGALGLFLLFRIVRSIKYKQVNLWREFAILALVLWLAFLSTQTFWPFTIRVDGFHPRVNLKLFQSISAQFTHGIAYKTSETTNLFYAIFIRNLLGNVLIFAPVGFLCALVLKEPKWYKVLLAGLAISFSIEIVQLFMPTRSFDVDDLLLNSLGSLLGFLIFKLFAFIPWFKRFANKTSRSERPHAARWASAFILTTILWSLAIFLHQFNIYKNTPWG